jgi:hypothetical protein
LRGARLIAQYGADIRLPKLSYILTADYPRAGAVSIGDRCSVYYPQLRP